MSLNGKNTSPFGSLNNEKEFFSLLFDCFYFFGNIFRGFIFICFGKRNKQSQQRDLFCEAQKECLICIRVKSTRESVTQHKKLLGARLIN
jgi:hypothetical protein